MAKINAQSTMAKIYAQSCMYDGKNFNTVPKRLQDQVRTIIEESGYVINEDGTVTPAAS